MKTPESGESEGAGVGGAGTGTLTGRPSRVQKPVRGGRGGRQGKGREGEKGGGFTFPLTSPLHSPAARHVTLAPQPASECFQPVIPLTAKPKLILLPLQETPLPPSLLPPSPPPLTRTPLVTLLHRARSPPSSPFLTLFSDIPYLAAFSSATGSPLLWIGVREAA